MKTFIKKFVAVILCTTVLIALIACQKTFAQSDKIIKSCENGLNVQTGELAFNTIAPVKNISSDNAGNIQAKATPRKVVEYKTRANQIKRQNLISWYFMNKLSTVKKNKSLSSKH